MIPLLMKLEGPTRGGVSDPQICAPPSALQLNLLTNISRIISFNMKNILNCTLHETYFDCICDHPEMAPVSTRFEK